MTTYGYRPFSEELTVNDKENRLLFKIVHNLYMWAFRTINRRM